MSHKIIMILAICLVAYIFYYIKSVDLSEHNDDTACFYLSDNHIEDLKNMQVTWNIFESGAPMISSSISEVIFPGNIKTNDFLNTRNKNALKGIIFEIYLDSANLLPEKYQFENPFYKNKDHMDRISHIPEIVKLYKQERIVFNFTEQHAKLLKSLSAGFLDNLHIVGVNPKRPYGEATFFEPDMADIIGEKYSVNSKNKIVMSEKQLKNMMKLHYELLPAMQALLIHGTVKTGQYCRDTPYSNWHEQEETINQKGSLMTITSATQSALNILTNWGDGNQAYSLYKFRDIELHGSFEKCDVVDDWFEKDFRKKGNDFLEFGYTRAGDPFALWIYLELQGEPPVVLLDSDGEVKLLAPSLGDFLCLLTDAESIDGRINNDKTSWYTINDWEYKDNIDDNSDLAAMKKKVKKEIKSLNKQIAKSLTCRTTQEIINDFDRHPNFKEWFDKMVIY